MKHAITTGREMLLVLSLLVSCELVVTRETPRVIGFKSTKLKNYRTKQTSSFSNFFESIKAEIDSVSGLEPAKKVTACVIRVHAYHRAVACAHRPTQLM